MHTLGYFYSQYASKTLHIAKQLLDKALEAQACYSLGNTYTLLRDYEKAIEFHLRHLEIAQLLADRVGEGRACWSLGNAYTALGNHQKALQFTSKHLHISKEIGDENGQISAQMNLADLRNLLGIVDGNKHGEKTERNGLSNNAGTDEELEGEEEDENKNNGLQSLRTRRFSMENMELMKLTPEAKAIAESSSQRATSGVGSKMGARPKTAKFQRAATVATENAASDGKHLRVKKTVARPKSADLLNTLSQDKPLLECTQEDETFFDLLSRTQGRRIDDQRCSFRAAESGIGAAGDGLTKGGPKTNAPRTPTSDNNNAAAATTPTTTTTKPAPTPAAAPRPSGQSQRPPSSQSSSSSSSSQLNSKNSPSPGEEFLDMIVGLQSSRMNDQRANLPQFPGLTSETVIRPYLEKQKDDSLPDDKFFDMLMRCQGTRLEDQRSILPSERDMSAPTVPDEDFFSLIQRVQSSRLEEQRTCMPAGPTPTPGPPSSAPSNSGSGAAETRTLQPSTSSKKKKK